MSSESERKDWHSEPFEKLVILGESTVEGGDWLGDITQRWGDVLTRLIDSCQETPLEYINKGIGANAISPRSPGYELSAKPSAMERYEADVIAHSPDLFVCSYGLNDMRADMPLKEFIEALRKIVLDVKKACSPVTVLTTIYYMNGWKSYPPYDKGSVALTEKYNEAIASLADETDCILADIWSAEGYGDWLINPDGVHANKVGNLLIANRVFEAIANQCSGVSKSTYDEDMDRPWTSGTMEARESVGDNFDGWWRS